jgi:hypothetical protein
VVEVVEVLVPIKVQMVLREQLELVPVVEVELRLLRMEELELVLEQILEVLDILPHHSKVAEEVELDYQDIQEIHHKEQTVVLVVMD